MANKIRYKQLYEESQSKFSKLEKMLDELALDSKKEIKITRNDVDFYVSKKSKAATILDGIFYISTLLVGVSIISMLIALL